MKNNFEVIVFDNRDAGRSENVEENYELKDLGIDTVGLMDKLNIEKAHILGISMGGMIAQELVLNYPERVNKLVLASTNCGNPKSILPSKRVLADLTKDREGRSEKEIIEDFIDLLYTDKFIEENQII